MSNQYLEKIAETHLSKEAGLIDSIAGAGRKVAQKRKNTKAWKAEDAAQKGLASEVAASDKALATSANKMGIDKHVYGRRKIGPGAAEANASHSPIYRKAGARASRDRVTRSARDTAKKNNKRIPL